MKLYSYFQSSASYRVRIALNLKELPYEMEYINLVKGEQRSAEYAAVNPQMLVPTFIDKEHKISQSLAIMEYLEETYPEHALLPEAPSAKAYVRELALTIACETAPLGNLKVRKYLSATLGHNKDEEEKWIQHWIAEGLEAFEKRLDLAEYHGHFCYANSPTMADCCLIPQLFNARRFKCDLSAYPHILQIEETCRTHPAFITAHPHNQTDAV